MHNMKKEVSALGQRTEALDPYDLRLFTNGYLNDVLILRQDADPTGENYMAQLAALPKTDLQVSRVAAKTLNRYLKVVLSQTGRYELYAWDGQMYTTVDQTLMHNRTVLAIVDGVTQSFESVLKRAETEHDALLETYQQTIKDIPESVTGEEREALKKEARSLIPIRYARVAEDIHSADFAQSKYQAENHRKNLAKLIQQQLQVRDSAFTSNRFFSFDNGVIDTEQVMNGEDLTILPHDPSRFITQRNRLMTEYVDYDDVFDINDFNSIGAPNIEKFVSGSFQCREDGVNLLRSLGVALFSDSEKLKTVVIIYGNNNSGKSMVIRIMDELAGGMVSEGGADIFAVGKDKYAGSDIEGQRIVVSSEMQDAAVDQEDVKKWSGGDKRRTLRKYKESIEWKPEGMLFFVANSKSEVTDLFDLSDPAMKERALYVHFPHTFGQSTTDEYVADKKIEARIKTDELGQFAYILLRLCRDWVAAGHEDRIPKTANQERIADLIEGATDPVQAYLNEGVQQAAWHVSKVETPTSHLLPFPTFWKAYQAWYEKAYDVKLKKNKILDQLRADGMIEIQGTRYFVKGYTPNQSWAYLLHTGDINEETINGYTF